MHDLEDIYRNLFRFLGSLNKDSWRKMRRLVGIEPYQEKCSDAQYLGLWAYAAIRRQNPTKGIHLDDVNRFIRENGTDPRAYMPGLTQDDLYPVPSNGVDAIDLRATLRDCFNLRIPQSTVERYCRHLFGESYSVHRWYSKEQIEQLAHHRAKLAAENKARLIKSGFNLVQYNQQRKSDRTAC